MSEPLSCWVLKIAGHLVVLPLSGDSTTSQPLKELQKLGGGQPLTISGLASWSFPHSGRSAPFRFIWLAQTPRSRWSAVAFAALCRTTAHWKVLA